jgi:adenosylcobinamide-phosphate synthase
LWRKMEKIFLLVSALFLDLTLGEPPTIVHPVGWMGKVIAGLIQCGKGHAHAIQFLIGMGVSIFTIGLFSAAVYFLLNFLHDFNFYFYVVVGAFMLKSSFALKGLRQAAQKIRNLLNDEKLEQARFELRALVGRNTRQLDKNLAISATIESAAENICDSFFAPLLYFALLGVPGAVAYRAINTLDAMIGHHGEYEYLGKFAARLDTLANYIPARLAALTIVLATWMARQNTRAAWRTMVNDRRKTESPNAGWTMSAMAGALGVQLEKVGYYKLGESKNPLVIQHIDTALKIVTIAALVWSALIVMGEVIYHAAT